MSDSIGRIPVPDLVASGITFPSIPCDYGVGFSQQRPIVTHSFGTADAKIEQRFAVGIGPRKFQFKRSYLNLADRRKLKAFWEGLPTDPTPGSQGPWASFTYPVLNPDKSTTPTTVMFENAPLSLQYLQTGCQAGVTLVEVIDPDDAPRYTTSATYTRFPSTTVEGTLQGQAQQIIPLVRIRVREAGVDDIYVSDRRCYVDGRLYQARVLNFGEPGSDAIMTQDIKGTADNVQFAFGNADRVMTKLANDTDLKFATIELSLLILDPASPTTGTKLDLWAGFIRGFVSDGTAQFAVSATDGLYQVTQMYPPRVVSRTCWKPYKDGNLCPYTGSLATCDYYFDSVNGCVAHGMQAYFGGHPANPQGINIKDNSTGIWGLGRNNVTATSIVSDNMWGKALQEIWCNSHGDPGRSFIVNAMVIAGRDESDFYDALGIIGAGPIGATTYQQVYANADGYRYIIAPLLDGQPAHGFKVDSALNVTQDTALGLRVVLGNDPCDLNSDQFALGSGSGGNYTYTPAPGHTIGFAAGTAFVELRRVDQPGIQATAADSHSMTVPIDEGLFGWSWNAAGTQAQQRGMTNPFWVAVNVFLRGLGLYGASSAAQLATFVLASLTTTDGSGAGDIANLGVAPLVSGGWIGSSIQGIRVLNGGSHVYPIGSTAPVGIFISGGGGDGTATAYGTTDPMTGKLMGVTVTNPGHDFTAIPSVQADSNGDAQFQVTLSAPTGFTETQFEFQGVLADQKPLRDWLAEILACGMGYFTFEFGRLKLGIRSNASAVNAFTLGNMLYQSLHLEPIEAAFEHLVIDFADAAYQYQANTAEYTDRDHAAYYGRSAAPLTARQHLVGVGSLSQALRLAAIRTREEIGGVNAAEWRRARMASWKTTILALGTEVGQVVSVTHPDMPGLRGTCNVAGTAVTWDTGDAFDNSMVNHEALINGVQVTITAVADGAHLTVDTDLGTHSGVAYQVITGDFRIQSWRLNKDYSIDITAKTVVPSMYDLEVGPKPADVVPRPYPGLNYPIPLGAMWAPGYVNATPGDPLYSGSYPYTPPEQTFEVDQEYTTLADGSKLAEVKVTGHLPVNQASPGCGAPTVGNYAVAATGGHLAGGKTYRVALCAVDANGFFSVPSSLTLISTPVGTSTNSIMLNGVVWPSVAGLTGWAIFASDQDDLICQQNQGPLVALENNTYANGIIPLAINSALQRSTVAMPSPYTSRVRIKVKTDGTYGVAGFPIDAVSTDYRTLTIRYLIASPPLANFNPVGRAISVIGRQTGATPFLSATITSYDPATGECGITGNGILGTSSTNPAYVFQPGDVCVLRYKADPLTITPTSVTDSSMMSPEYPSGWAVGAQVGQLIRVIAGTSRGQIRKVVANTATQLTWDLPMVLDETSVWIMEPPAWSYVADSAAIQNADYDQASLMHIPVTNYSHRCILVAPFTVDIYGGESADGDEIVRELYIFGEPGTSSGGGTVEGYYNIPIASGHATPDLSQGLNQEVILNTAPVAIDAPTNSRQVTWSLILAQDSTGGRAVTFDSTYIGADALPGMLNTAPSTYSSLDFIVQPDGKCALSNIVSGVPLG